ncbi:hypothetical protein DL98DRAFT_654454 [Cadophora sp. DSE1049]|nr:hypothetical protein DL98DRAFT_654454 [Cadophora sp. DSE1049]
MTHYTPNPSSSRSQGLSNKSARDTQIYRNESASISKRGNKKSRTSTDRPHHGISFNLVSLVTKFEALDALSLPFTTPSLQPAPLQISRNSSRQKEGTGFHYRRRLSTIFSPKRGSSEKRENGPSEAELQPAYTDIFDSLTSRTLGSLDKKADSRKLRKAQTSYKPSSIRLRGGVWDPSDAFHGRGIGAVAAPYIENERLDEKKGGSIRDKIRFYDGTVSTGNNTRANPSASNTAARNTPISLSRTRLLDKSYFLTPSTGSSRRTCLRNPNAETITATRTIPASTSKQTLESGSVRHQALAQSSPSRSSLSNVTPRTMDSPGRYKNGRETSLTQLPIRNGRIPGQTRGRRNAMVESKQCVPPSLGGDGSAPPPIVGQDQSSRPLSRRRLSNRIGELYRAKSIEKKRNDGQEKAQRRAETMPSISQAKIALGFERRITEPTEPRSSKLSGKVATMRKLFDGKFSRRSASLEGPVPCCALDPVSLEAATSFSRYKQEQMVELRDLTPPKPPTPPPMSPSKQRKASKVSLRNDRVPAASSAIKAFDPTKARKLQSASPIKKLSPPKSKLIVEKVKIFETASGTVPEAAHPRRGKAFRRRLSKSLRSFFEAPSGKSQEEESERNKAAEKSAGTKRVVSPDGSGLVSKRGTIVGRWNNVPTAVSSGGDGTTSEKHSPSPAEEDVFTEMVVKGVECGLKQPRPVRAVEMKRMALLCKDRMGEFMDREKGRVSQRRKF